jgi:hypothetical protein
MRGYSGLAMNLERLEAPFSMDASNAPWVAGRNLLRIYIS